MIKLWDEAPETMVRRVMGPPDHTYGSEREDIVTCALLKRIAGIIHQQRLLQNASQASHSKK